MKIAGGWEFSAYPVFDPALLIGDQKDSRDGKQAMYCMDLIFRTKSEASSITHFFSVMKADLPEFLAEINGAAYAGDEEMIG